MSQVCNRDASVGYAICTTMRSGSTWLAELLSATGMLGHPSEYFSTDIQRKLGDPDYPDDVRAQVDRVLEDGRTPNGVYGFKIYPFQLEEIGRRLAWTEVFSDLKFVHYQRRDLLGQAISRCIVLQTRQWRSTLPIQGTPVYDGRAILDAMRRTLEQDARWRLFFARNGIEPLYLVYEDALAAPQAALDAVARLVGVTACPAPLDPGIAIQRDATTVLWRRRFVEEYADLLELDSLR